MHGDSVFMDKFMRIIKQKGYQILISILSVRGICLDYPAFNITGYLFYGVYSTAGYFFHNSSAGEVKFIF